MPFCGCGFFFLFCCPSHLIERDNAVAIFFFFSLLPFIFGWWTMRCWWSIHQLLPPRQVRFPDGPKEAAQLVIWFPLFLLCYIPFLYCAERMPSSLLRPLVLVSLFFSLLASTDNQPPVHALPLYPPHPPRPLQFLTRTPSTPLFFFLFHLSRGLAHQDTRIRLATNLLPSWHANFFFLPVSSPSHVKTYSDERSSLQYCASSRREQCDSSSCQWRFNVSTLSGIMSDPFYRPAPVN